MWKPINFIGHYLTPDPIKLAGGLNNYHYVPNFTGWVEPLGVESDTPGRHLTGGWVLHSFFAAA